MTADAKTVTVMEIHPNFKTVTVTVIWGKLILKNNKTAGNNFDSNGNTFTLEKRSGLRAKNPYNHALKASTRMQGHKPKRCRCTATHLETNLASRWEGVRLPRASGKSPDFPGSSPNFPGSFSATSPEVLSLWNLTAIQRFPGSSPNFPGSSLTSPEVSPFLWEA